MHSLQMYTDGPEMNFRTESFDFPQNEQRRCFSWDIDQRGTRDACPANPDIEVLLKIPNSGREYGQAKAVGAGLVKIFTSNRCPKSGLLERLALFERLFHLSAV